MSLYDRILRHLDPDQRIITKESYLKRPWLYDNVSGEVYLIGVVGPDGHVTKDFLWASSLKYFHRRVDPEDIVIFKDFLVVRVRSSDPIDVSGEYITNVEYKERPNDYEVLDIFVSAVRKDFPYKVVNISVEEYQTFRDVYDLIDVTYFVTARQVLR